MMTTFPITCVIQVLVTWKLVIRLGFASNMFRVFLPSHISPLSPWYEVGSAQSDLSAMGAHCREWESGSRPIEDSDSVQERPQSYKCTPHGKQLEYQYCVFETSSTTQHSNTYEQVCKHEVCCLISKEYIAWVWCAIYLTVLLGDQLGVMADACNSFNNLCIKPACDTTNP